MRQILLPLVVVAVGVGCGGNNEPLLPADAGASWAEDADAVVAALEAGDGCAALDRVETLRSEVTSSEDVPPAAEQELVGALDDLASQITCAPPAEDEDGADRGRNGPPEDRGEDRDDEGDDNEDEGDGEEGEGRGNGTKGRDS